MNTGGFGARVSTWITRIADAGDVPPRLLALALTRCAPSDRLTWRDHMPDAVVTVVPSEVESSKSSTVDPGSAVPVNMTGFVLFQL